MQVGVITLDGRQVGVITYSQSGFADTFTPDLGGYEPEGRAADSTLPGLASPRSGHHHYVGHHHAENAAPTHHHADHAASPQMGPEGRAHAEHEDRAYDAGGHPFRQSSGDVDQAIVEASRAHHLDPNTMRAIASIESDMTPGSNANRATQYKGLYQIGHDEWRRFGEGNIYNARDNAMAAARMFEANRAAFRETHGGREPTDSELYMLHQQGLGFTTPGIKRGQDSSGITNARGNPYPGMHGAQTRESFEAGWGREVARRKARFAAEHAQEAEKPTFDPGTMAP